MILDQIRRIRAAYEAQIAGLNAKIAELQGNPSPELQAELDAFEAEVTPKAPEQGN